jgi:hypothetical protein
VGSRASPIISRALTSETAVSSSCIIYRHYDPYKCL